MKWVFTRQVPPVGDAGDFNGQATDGFGEPATNKLITTTKLNYLNIWFLNKKIQNKKAE